MAVKSLEEAKRHFEEASAVVATRYEEGVRAASWRDKAMSDDAEKNYAGAMSEVIAKKKRAKGIAKVSDDEWRTKAITKGAAVIGDRMRGAVSDYERGFRPYHEVIKSTVETLPAKGLDPMANIDRRLKPLVAALRKKKEELSA